MTIVGATPTAPDPGAPDLAHRTAATLLSVLLLVLAVVTASASERLPVDIAFTLPWSALLVLYLLAGYFTLGFPRREGSVLVVLVQLPLALGVVLVDPLTHLGVRLLAVAVVDLALRRRGPLKTVVNLAIASLEVALASGLLTLLHPPTSRPGPLLWLCLLFVLLVTEVASQLVLHLVFLVLGIPRTRRDLLEPLGVEAATTAVFTGVAVLTLAAAWTDPSTLLVVAALAGALVLSYRAYRRLAAEQRATEELYAFVKVLGPVDVEQPSALQVLEHVRELLHAKHLELAISDRTGGLGRTMSVHLGAGPEVREGRLPSAQGTDLQAESMTTPLVVGGTFLGILTARRRVTSDRGFDMKDLRLFETVATELATAVDRGRLIRDLEQAASTDPTTDLPNLRSVTQGIAALLSRHGSILLAAVAVDSFREVNDTLGHQVGDDLLREVAARLHAVAPDALIGRIGGGRFAVAVPSHLAGEDVGLFALGLRSQVEGGAQLGAVSTHVRLSVGCVRAPEHGTDGPTVLRRAETAMYSARSAHGGPVLWEPAYEVQGNRRLAVVTALREALANGAIATAFQAKVSTRTGAVTGVEALARWTHPALGEVDPVEFVPLAEASGLMGLLTHTILGQALAACRGWQDDDRRVGVSVNVSSETLQNAGFVTDVAAALRLSGVQPGLLTLELTEDVVVADPVLAGERMRELRALGVSLSVDDFGTGYSSLTYLKGLPVDEVKVDRGFVEGVVDDLGDQAVVRAVVDIAHTLGLSVVAEGVESEEQHRVLHSLGVDEVQGFLHARPMPASDMASFLRRRDAVRRLG